MCDPEVGLLPVPDQIARIESQIRALLAERARLQQQLYKNLDKTPTIKT